MHDHAGWQCRPFWRVAMVRRYKQRRHHSGGDTFAIREWLAADADGRDVHDRGLGGGIGCDPSGCIGKLADGGLVAYGLEPDAFEEDCRRPAIVIAAARNLPPIGPSHARALTTQHRVRKTSKRTSEPFSSGGTARPVSLGCERDWAAGYEPHRRCSPARARSKRRGGGTV